jgi:FAD/FMN-containing dehydrogenase/Fe-S oxidoreductase|nr:MAG: FAD-binding oxidoreductase [bacterium]
MRARVQPLGLEHPARRPPRILPAAAAPSRKDGEELACMLRARIAGEVRFSAGDRGLYADDASNYRFPPLGVVIPQTTDDIVETIAACRAFGAPVVFRGGGTGLAGQTVNAAVVIDVSKYLRAVLEIDPARRRARVQPGTVLDALRSAAAQHGLTFGPDPATHGWNTLGGMIANNSCGSHSVQAEFYGPGARTSDNLISLEVLTYRGVRLRVGATTEAELDAITRGSGPQAEIYRRLRDLRDRYADLIRARYPKIPRRVSGYNLDELLPEKGFNVARALAGTEGTCVAYLEAELTLIPDPPERVLLVLGFPDVAAAGDHVPLVREHRPLAIEGLDDRLVADLRVEGFERQVAELLPAGGGFLLVEFGGDTLAEARDRAQRLMDELRRAGGPPTMVLHDRRTTAHELWELREAGLGATALVPGLEPAWPGWEDSAVPPDRVGDYLRDLRRLMNEFGYQASLYGHFGQGLVHCSIDFDLVSRGGIARYREFVERAADIVIGYGGSLSGEHGDGQARGELLTKMFGPELVQAFREFKAIWDPDGKMNPGKVVDARPLDADLRLGPDYEPPWLETAFALPNDGGSFARATLRCQGIGKCRKLDTGTMCPSYMVLREEKHTTRGRARLLFEMLKGDPVSNGWRDENVKEALDLCLACKGCKHECPVSVDMATYKAEFFSHYYARRLRPLSAYAYGLVFWWARAASLAPGLANLAVRTPGLRGLARAAVRMAPERQFPTVAPRTFTSWFRRRGTRIRGGPEVILWPDTFNNRFHPEIAAAAVDVLEDAGYRVVVPRTFLCCGRPLYDFGMLDVAEHQLRRVIEALRPQIRAGTPIVGLEPSCVSVFRDELHELFPNDPDAQRLRAQAMTLAEFLVREARGYEPPRLHARAIVHGHCHHKAIMRLDAEEQLLPRIGLDFRILDSGCCGMAGSFGFERDKYDVSIGAGERVLLPAVRAAGQDTIIIADGFSCREQIRQTTDRRALHLAQVLRMALESDRLPAGRTPESYAHALAPRELVELPSPSAYTVAALGAGLAVGGALAWRLARGRW